MQQVFDTDELEHDTGPDVEQPELILLNKFNWPAGLTNGFGFACDKPTSATRSRAANM